MVFVKKLNFSPSVFWGQLKPEKMFFYILDRNECVLDQKSEILKISKKSNFPKGSVHGFCQKIEIFTMCVYWANQTRQHRFWIFWIEKNAFWTKQSDLSKKYKESKFSERRWSTRFVNNWPSF